MEPKTHISKHRILELLDYVKDPEIPAINVLELGVVPGKVFVRLAVFVAMILVSCCSPNRQDSGNASEGSPEPNSANLSVSVSIPPESSYIEETFYDSLNVGRKGVNNLVLSQIRTDDSVFVHLLFQSKAGGRLVERNNSAWLKDGITSLQVTLSDLNSDGYNDVTFVSSIAARSVNEIRRLFIYDPVGDSLVYITNSMYYPNLRYNDKLDCIDGFRVYGGSSTDFLRLHADSLFMFATVDLMDGVTVTTLDAEGNRTIIHKDTAYEGGYIRFENYDPLVEMQGDW